MSSFAFDATCRACGTTHVVTLPHRHDPGDTIGLAHISGAGACHRFAAHRIEAILHGVNGSG